MDAYHFSKKITNTDSIKTAKKWRGPKDDWLTIHDPFLQDLQFLIDDQPNTEILSLEIALDFTLKDGSNDPVRLVELHSWLKVCLYPQRHTRMQGGYRKYYDASDKSIKLDAIKTRSSNRTVYWQNSSHYDQVRLYIKTLDNGKSIGRHSVRLEITLSRGGCQRAKVQRVGLFPIFAKNMRRYLSPFLNVAKGIKPEVKRIRSKNPVKLDIAASKAVKEQARAERNWKCYGAAWAANHDYRIIPDTDTNRLIGSGLKGLQDSLRKLKLTRKVVEYPDYEVWKPA